jgi:hypothetical protein
MRRTRRYALPCALLVTLWGACTDDPVSPARQLPGLQATVDIIAGRVEEIRGLRFIRPVTGVALDRSVFTDYVSGSYGSDESFAKGFALELYQLGYSDDPAHDVAGEYQEMMSTGVDGYYIPGTDTLVVINYEGASSEESRFRLNTIVAHELVHALQDQHLWDRGGPLLSTLHNSREQADFFLARNHLIEGEADFTATVYVYAHLLGAADPVHAASSYHRMLYGIGLDIEELLDSGWVSKPLMLDYDLLSAYFVGPYFVDRLRRRGGWTAIDQAYERRSMTMAEVYAGEQSPMRVFPGARISAILDTGAYDYTDNDNMGALRMTSLFYEYLDSSAIANGLGWQGDHLFFMSRTTSRLGRMVWAFSFTTDGWADRFWTILSRYVRWDRAVAADLPSVADSSWNTTHSYSRKTWHNATYSVSLVRYENEIYWLENLGTERDSIIALLIGTASEPLAKRVVPRVAGGRYRRRRPGGDAGRERLIERLWRRYEQQRQ